MTYNFISAACQNLSRPMVPRLLVLTLGIMIFWQLIAGVISISALSHTTVPVSIVNPPPSNKAASTAGLKKSFFGKYVPLNLDDMDVKQSMLNLKVVGIMLGALESDSQVILHAAGGQDQTFHVGDTLPGGAILKRITADGVFVERNGALESLSFPKNELIFEPQPKPLIGD